MNKKKIILIFILIIYPFLSYSHVNHYNKIKYPESIDINYYEDLLMARDHAKKN